MLYWTSPSLLDPNGQNIGSDLVIIKNNNCKCQLKVTRLSMDRSKPNKQLESQHFISRKQNKALCVCWSACDGAGRLIDVLLIQLYEPDCLSDSTNQHQQTDVLNVLFAVEEDEWRNKQR